MVKKGLVPAGAQTDTGANFFAAFATGKIGIAPSGAFAIGALNTPSIPTSTTASPSCPARMAARRPLPAATISSSPRARKNSTVVKEFLDFAYSLEGQTILANYGSLPVRGDIAKEALKDLDPRYQIAAEAMAKGKTPYIGGVQRSDQLRQRPVDADDQRGRSSATTSTAPSPTRRTTMQSIIDQAPRSRACRRRGMRNTRRPRL